MPEFQLFWRRIAGKLGAVEQGSSERQHHFCPPPPGRALGCLQPCSGSTDLSGTGVRPVRHLRRGGRASRCGLADYDAITCIRAFAVDGRGAGRVPGARIHPTAQFGAGCYGRQGSFSQRNSNRRSDSGPGEALSSVAEVLLRRVPCCRESTSVLPLTAGTPWVTSGIARRGVSFIQIRGSALACWTRPRATGCSAWQLHNDAASVLFLQQVDSRVLHTNLVI